MASITPKTEDDIITALRIYRSAYIGPRNFRALTERAKSFAEAFDMMEKAYRERKHDLDQICSHDEAKRELERGADFGAKLCFHDDPDYPTPLVDLDGSPPFLWMKGKLELKSRPLVAVVGSRNATIEGARIARGISHDLASHNVVVVSGLARGIDAAAHEGALGNGTIACVAGGIDVFYPAQNRSLQENMFEHGLVISEMPFGHKPQVRNFPQRNRIIAGLSLATVVVEATHRSGTLITARQAGEFGREVMAIPGHPYSPSSSGANHLIREGALLVRDAFDMLEALSLGDFQRGRSAPPISTKAEQSSPTSAQNYANEGLAEIEGRSLRSVTGEVVSLQKAT